MSAADQTTCVAVLAGGRSRRMGGQNKSLMQLARKPLTGWTLQRLTGQAPCLGINANDDLKCFAQFGLPVFTDRFPGYIGPLAGIHAALHRCSEIVPSAVGVCTVPADTPFIPDNLVAQLVAQGPAHAIKIAVSDGRQHPVVAYWPLRLRQELQRWLYDDKSKKVMAFAQAYEHVFVRVRWSARDMAIWQPQMPELFFNINCPDDTETAIHFIEKLALRKQ